MNCGQTKTMNKYVIAMYAWHFGRFVANRDVWHEYVDAICSNKTAPDYFYWLTRKIKQ
jgi:hypothetical protein